MPGLRSLLRNKSYFFQKMVYFLRIDASVQYVFSFPDAEVVELVDTLS